MRRKRTRSASSPEAGYGPPPPSLFVDPTTRPEYVPGFTWDAEAADKPRKFIEKCCRHRAADGEALRVTPIPWFRDRILYPLFGWRRPNGRLRFRRFACWVPKKNWKTTSCSQIAQYANAVEAMDIFFAANVKDQARTMWRMVRDSIEASPILAPLFDIVDHKYLIRNRLNGKEMKCLSSDAKVSEGINGLVLVDEIHSFRKPDLVDTIMYATRGIPNAIIGSISTAGDNRNGIGWEWWEATELAIRDPASNPGLLGVTFAADPHDSRGFDDPEVWREANPGMGISFTEDEFRSDFEDARTHPRKFGKFLRYSLNIWTAPDNRAFPGDEFANCRKPRPDLTGLSCVLGMDMASNLDMTAGCFLFKLRDGSYYAVMRYWVPEETVRERETKDAIPYRSWANEGWLTVTPGARLNHKMVARDIIEFSKANRIELVGADPWQIGPLASMLEEESIDLKAVRPSTTVMNAPCKMLEGCVVEGTFGYDSPILLFNANNLVWIEDSTGMIKPDKEKSPEKIDGIVAAANAFAAAIVKDEELSARPSDGPLLRRLW
jgi:phage terminase large subunit-like protein